MLGELIYEKKYPNPWEESSFFTTPDEAEPSPQVLGEIERVSSKKLIESTVQVLMPERMETLPVFIDTAKEVGEQYELDTTIMGYDYNVTVSYALQIDVPYSCFKRILTLADELSVQPERDKIIVSLTYYTHTTYCGGRKIDPFSAI